jgi:DNA-binding transcriptional MocR family regulator
MSALGRDGGTIKEVSRKAQTAGVGFYPVDPCYLKPPKRTGIVLGYAPLREHEIREGIRRLATALA